MVQPLEVGVFLHSLALGNDVKAAIETARENELGVIQPGPLGDEYLVGDGVAAKRQELVSILKHEEVTDVDERKQVTVGPLCVCYEGKRARGDREDFGGVEEYGSIEHIAKTGGFGYEGPDSERILDERLTLAKEHVDLARYFKDNGVMSSEKAILTTHVGFFDRPEKRDQIKKYVKELVKYCHEKDVYLAIETGSEKMELLIEFIKEVETETGIQGRLGINYDPANFFLYGTQGPLKALNVLKQDDNRKYLFGVHIKDADKGGIIGAAKGDWKGKGEMVVGTGSVQWYKTMKALHELGYTGPLIIEREDPRATPESRLGDIAHARNNTLSTQAQVLKLGTTVAYIPFAPSGGVSGGGK